MANTKSGIRYIVFQEEIAPTTGTQHLQGYIVFENQRRLKTVGGVLPRAYWAIAKGSGKQNSEYCTKKEGRKPGTQPYIWGRMPREKKDGGPMEKER
jgi:hypothetical protein